ncbi:MAG: HAMP domain-containing protein, partial [Nitrospinota bacterium]
DLSFLRETASIQRVREGISSGSKREKKAALKNLELDFLNFANQKRIYQKLLFADKSGKELVRIDMPKDKSVIARRSQMQDISRMYYFKDSISLEDEGIMISSLELSREGGEIVQPLLPTIRYATPVYNSRKQVVGSVMLNVRAHDFLKIVRNSLNEKGMLFLIDKDGYYLVHADPGMEWGSATDLNTGENFLNDFDEETYSEIVSNTSLLTIKKKGHIMSTVPVFLDKERTLPLGYLVDIVPRNVVFAPAASFRNVFIIAVIAVIFVSLVFSIILAGSITTPLVYLTKGAEEMSKGNIDMEIQVKSKDEIKILAESIERLRKSVKFLIGRAKKA